MFSLFLEEQGTHPESEITPGDTEQSIPSLQNNTQSQQTKTS